MDSDADGTDRRSESALGRRSFLRGALAGTAGAAGMTLGLPAVAGARRLPLNPSPVDILKESAVGMYTDMSVANQASSFSLNRSMVSCGVGTLALGDWSGPFSMLMYATRIDTFAVLREAKELHVTGRMRSITKIAGLTMEDVQHDFLAVAAQKRGSRPDRFDVMFKTPFWTPGSNVMATPADDNPNLARFGGHLLMGSIRLA